MAPSINSKFMSMLEGRIGNGGSVAASEQLATLSAQVQSLSTQVQAQAKDLERLERESVDLKRQLADVVRENNGLKDRLMDLYAKR